MTHCRGPSILARADSEFYCVALLGAALLYLIDHALEIGIAGAKAPGKPIAATLDNVLAIGEYIKLAGLARRNHGLQAQPLLDQGRETRGLGLIVSSRGAG